MSSAVRTDFPANRTEREEIFFWIRPKDEEGLEVDQVFAKAAYSKARDLRFYRWKELSDQAVRANLVERAVLLASRSQRGSSVQDPQGYLFTVFARLVDRLISRERLLPQQCESDLDRHLHARTRFQSPRNNVDREILQDQILMAMAPDERWAWQRRLIGYEVQEIAAELNVSPDCLSTRLRRGAKDAIKKLHSGRARE